MTTISHRDRRDATLTSAVPAETLTVADLATAEALLIWGARYWVGTVADGGDPRPHLERGFRHGRVDDAIEPFDALLGTAVEAALDHPEINTQRSREIGGGERALLRVLALSQHGRAGDALAALTHWISRDSLLRVSGLVARVAAIFAREHLILPLRDGYLTCRARDIRNARGTVIPVLFGATRSRSGGPGTRTVTAGGTATGRRERSG